MSDEILVRKKQIAAFFGVSTQAVDGWTRRGCPVAEHDRAGRIKRMDLQAVIQWRFDHSKRSYRHLGRNPDEVFNAIVNDIGRFEVLRSANSLLGQLGASLVAMTSHGGLTPQQAAEATTFFLAFIVNLTDERIGVQWDYPIDLDVLANINDLDTWERDKWPKLKAKIEEMTKEAA